MFIQLTKKDGKVLFGNILNFVFDETDLGLVVHLNTGEKWLVQESLNDVKYAIAQSIAHGAQSGGNNTILR
ncbi:MAG: hypothetical protein QXZ51_05020 [Candidatus Bathyarchaeia archaeon]